MTKRSKLEIIRDILTIANKNHNSINITPLIRRSNMSSERFREYYQELLNKDFLREVNSERNKIVNLTEKGLRFLEKYKAIISFIEDFDL